MRVGHNGPTPFQDLRQLWRVIPTPELLVGSAELRFLFQCTTVKLVPLYPPTCHFCYRYGFREKSLLEPLLVDIWGLKSVLWRTRFKTVIHYVCAQLGGEPGQGVDSTMQHIRTLTSNDLQFGWKLGLLKTMQSLGKQLSLWNTEQKNGEGKKDFWVYSLKLCSQNK